MIGVDLVEHALAERQPGIDARRLCCRIMPGAQHQPVRDDFRFLGIFLEDGHEKAGKDAWTVPVLEIIDSFRANSVASDSPAFEALFVNGPHNASDVEANPAGVSAIPGNSVQSRSSAPRAGTKTPAIAGKEPGVHTRRGKLADG